MRTRTGKIPVDCVVGIVAICGLLILGARLLERGVARATALGGEAFDLLLQCLQLGLELNDLRLARRLLFHELLRCDFALVDVGDDLVEIDVDEGHLGAGGRTAEHRGEKKRGGKKKSATKKAGAKKAGKKRRKKSRKKKAATSGGDGGAPAKKKGKRRRKKKKA